MSINWNKIKSDQRYRVEWLDIQSHTNEKLKKPYSKNLCVSFTEGSVLRDKDTVIVIYGGNEDDDLCFDAIPLKIVTNITKIV